MIEKKVASIILENNKGELLLYLRDNKPHIPFPGHWDLFGGHIEEGETPEKALMRELKEELDLDLKKFTFFKIYECFKGDAWLNIKYIYSGKINTPAQKLTLKEGALVQYFTEPAILNLKCANIVKSIIIDYLKNKTSKK
jgi:8-oxo-dGTP diphosphatase